MAKLPKHNVIARTIADKGARQDMVPFTDAANGGTLVSLGVRAMPCDVIASLVDAWLQGGGKRGMAVIGHGVRIVSDSENGRRAPCFIERKGFAEGTLYIFKGVAKKAPLLEALGADNVAGVRDESKGGLYITLTAGANVEHVLTTLCRPEFMTDTAPVGYDSGKGAALITLGEDTPSMPAPDTGAGEDAGAQAATEDAPKGKRGKGRKVQHVTE